MFRPHLWPVAHSLIPCSHEYTAAHMAGWVLGQNTVDPHRPTHSHTLYAYKAYCAPTHICTVYIQTGPIYMLLAHSMSHSTCTQHEQRTCTQRAQRALRHAPRRMYAIACLTRQLVWSSLLSFQQLTVHRPSSDLGSSFAALPSFQPLTG